MTLCKEIAWLEDTNELYKKKNVLHNKGWSLDTNPSHVEPPMIPLVTENFTGKSDGDDVKLKLRRDTTYSTSDLYGFGIYLFDHS